LGFYPKRKKIAIIGSGYVGRAAAKALRGRGHFVTLTTRSPDRAKQISEEADRVVLIQSGQFAEALQGQQIILLTVAPDSPASDQAYEETYLGCAKALLSDLDPNCEQILYTSSSSVYGEQGGALVDESTPLKPETFREKILIETEKLIQTAPCKFCIVRLGEIIGPGRMILDRLKALNGRSLAGTGANICNLSPIEEIVTALVTAIEHCWKGIYNVCSDQHLPRRELYDQLCKEAGLPPPRWDASRSTPHAGNKTVSSAKYLITSGILDKKS
jgi:nucleoside-diphosphate-sugar epimerase